MAHLNEIEGKDQQARAVSALGIYYRGLIVFGGRHAPEGLKLRGSSRGVRPLLKSGDSNRAHTIRPGCGQPPLCRSCLAGSEGDRSHLKESRVSIVQRCSGCQLSIPPSISGPAPCETSGCHLPPPAHTFVSLARVT